jgi:hypothetical protein
MKTFQAKRIAQEYIHTLPAAPAKVFPLLCPVREYDWIDGWTCNLIYSDTGVAENNCVFTTDFPRGVEETWVVSRYEPELHVIQFVIVTPGAYVMKLDISLKESGDNSTSVLFATTFTGLTPEGNAFIEKYCEETNPARMDLLFKILDHYCATGKMLKKDSILARLHSTLRRS